MPKPRNGIRRPRIPKQNTLKRYGLSASEWFAIAQRQGFVCAVCRKLPENGRLCTDHEHVKGWKRMPPDQRKRYVRGLLCYFCNHYYVGRAITVEKAANVLTFLKAHEIRKIQSAGRV